MLTMHSTEYGRCGNNIYAGQSEAVRHREWQGIFVAERVICVSKGRCRTRSSGITAHPRTNVA
jgi:hypothetical protein